MWAHYLFFSIFAKCGSFLHFSDVLTRFKDMGLGKTLTALALILNSLQDSSQRSSLIRRRPTLIITPLSGTYDVIAF